MIRAPLLLLAAAALAGCAATGHASRGDEFDTLARECEQRGGTLTRIPGAHHANERANWACELRSGGGRTR